MAEVNYMDYGDEDGDMNDSDMYSGGDDEYGFDDTEIQETHLPIDKLDTYIQSDNTYTRQLVAGGLLDVLKSAKDKSDRSTVLDALTRLSQDEEPSVRMEIMDRIPGIAEFCMGNLILDGFSDVLPTSILPAVLRCLHDNDNQVRKTAQTALFILLENHMIEQVYIDETVCSVIMEMFVLEKLSDEYRTEAVTLMVRISPLVSRHVVETQFLPRFCDLCSESLFHIRKVCATSIGEMCRVVGPELAETHLLPKFFNLCEDGIWGVRKACTECFMEVSNSLSPLARRNELAQLFVGLLCDQSRWVRMSAFQALGPFISTFADPDMTGLYFDQDGILRVCDTDSAANQTSRKSSSSISSSEPISTDHSKQISREESATIQIDSMQPTQLHTENVNTGSTEVQPFSPPVPAASEVVGTTQETDNSNKDTGNSSTDGGGISEASEQMSNVNQTQAELQGDQPTEREPDTHVPVAASTAEEMELCSGGDENEQENEDVESNMQRVQANTSHVSPEEVRWQQYSNSTELVYVQGQPESSKLEDFGSFKYWREPVPTLDLESILQEVRQSEPVTQESISEQHPDTQPPADTEETSTASSEKAAIEADAAEKGALSALTDLASKITVSEQKSLSANENKKTDSPQATAGFMFGPTSTPTGSIASMATAPPLSQTYASVLTGGAGVVQPPSSASHSRHISVDSSGDESATTLSELIAKQQDIIPPLLLENYLSMTDPSRAQTVDSDIAQHCAYSLPAVAYTLGKNNWKCLRSLYQTLVSDMQWKVRRTLAYSIHELAIILGPQLTHSDLIPIFDDFIKDLDEVRIGVLAHLADFLKLLNAEARRSYLLKLPEFMKTDNSRVWRPRLDLANQLVKMIELYSAQDVVDCVVPIAMCLLTDTIADVRTASLGLISRILKLLQDPGVRQLRLMLINDLIEKLAYSNQWHGRQTFVKSCYRVLLDNSLEMDQFSKELLPSILTLGEDKIPNVRLAVAELMSQCLLPTEYFTGSQNPHHDDLLQLETRLKNDKDRDVRFYAKLSLQNKTNTLTLSMIDV